MSMNASYLPLLSGPFTWSVPLPSAIPSCGGSPLIARTRKLMAFPFKVSASYFRLTVIVGIFSANVRDDRSPLAFGMAPAREAESAGAMTKVPKAW